MEQTEQEQTERRYLITGKEEDQLEYQIFNQMVKHTKVLDKIRNYSLFSYEIKKINFRYFDTFPDAKLTQSEVLVYAGPLEEKRITNGREQEEDYVLTVMFPKGDFADERNEFEAVIPAGIEFDKIDVEDYTAWPSLKQAKQYGGNKPLTEIIRLAVISHRFGLEQGGEEKVHFAFDEIEASNPFMRKRFYELMVEKWDLGEDSDVEEVCSFFTKKYKENLIPSHTTRLTKAYSLLRGEKIS